MPVVPVGERRGWCQEARETGSDRMRRRKEEVGARKRGRWVVPGNEGGGWCHEAREASGARKREKRLMSEGE
eukprot:1515726-Pleurochrysis_carterae.AAC.1